MNNEINNQNYNGQSMNQQPMNNQYQNYNGQSMNQQPMNNQYQNYNGQSMNQQPMNNQYQNYNGNPMPNPNKKDNKMLFIIIGVIVLIIVAIVVLVVVLNGNSSKGNTINDYENSGVVNNNDNNPQEINNSGDSDENSITFKGFNIPKQNGYRYEMVSTSQLLIGNNNFATAVQVTYGTLEEFNAKKDELVAKYNDLGMNPRNVQVSNYGEKEALTIEITSSGQNALFYIIDAGNNYSFIGITMNSSFSIDYNDIKTTVSLLSNAKYTGTYKSKTNDIDVIEFKNLFE